MGGGSNNLGSIFMWSIMPLGVSAKDVKAFVNSLFKVLSNWGDGVNLKWNEQMDAAVLGQIIRELRLKLMSAGLKSTQISVTAPFNSLWKNSTRPSAAAKR